MRWFSNVCIALAMRPYHSAIRWNTFVNLRGSGKIHSQGPCPLYFIPSECIPVIVSFIFCLLNHQLLNWTIKSGGGKSHHLSMEAKLWYKQLQESDEEKSKIYATQLPFNGKLRSFREICPNHLESSKTSAGTRKLRKRPRSWWCPLLLSQKIYRWSREKPKRIMILISGS